MKISFKTTPLPKLFVSLRHRTKKWYYCNMRLNISLLRNWLKRKWLLLLAILACIIPIIIYMIRFSGHEFSKDPSDWGTFGDYVGGVYSVLLSIIAIYVTYMISGREDKSREKRKILTELYKTIISIKSEEVDLNKVNKIVSLADSNQLLLPKVVYADIIRYSDYLKEIYGKPAKIDLHTEKRIKDELIEVISE